MSHHPLLLIIHHHILLSSSVMTQTRSDNWGRHTDSFSVEDTEASHHRARQHSRTHMQQQQHCALCSTSAHTAMNILGANMLHAFIIVRQTPQHLRPASNDDMLLPQKCLALLDFTVAIAHLCLWFRCHAWVTLHF